MLLDIFQPYAERRPCVQPHAPAEMIFDGWLRSLVKCQSRLAFHARFGVSVERVKTNGNDINSMVETENGVIVR